MASQPTRKEIVKFYDHVTEKLLLGHSVRAARQEEIRCLNTFLVCKKVPEKRTQKAKNASQSGGVMSTRETAATWQFDHDLWDENIGGKIRSCRARSGPLHHWKVSGTFSLGSNMQKTTWSEIGHQAACAGPIPSAFPSTSRARILCRFAERCTQYTSHTRLLTCLHMHAWLKVSRTQKSTISITRGDPA